MNVCLVRNILFTLNERRQEKISDDQNRDACSKMLKAIMDAYSGRYAKIVLG